MDGGDQTGGSFEGNGGDAGTLYLNIENDFTFTGNIFARGGRANSGSTCGTYGHRGKGGRNIFNKPKTDEFAVTIKYV